MNEPERSLLARSKNARIAENREAIAMLAINDSAANQLDLRGAYFDGSLELLR